MAVSVVGLPLETARTILEEEGIEISSVEMSQPPENTGHPPPPEKKCDLYVAGQYEAGPGQIRLRIVAVPAIEIS